MKTREAGRECAPVEPSSATSRNTSSPDMSPRPLARRSSPPDAPSTPRPRGEWPTCEDATGVVSARWRFRSVANFWSASFRNFVPSPVLSPIARAPHKICHPLCCVVFPHTSRQTRATVRACGREKRRTPRTSSRRVRRRGCSPCIFARRWGHAVVAGKPAEPSTGERRSDSAFGLKG